MSQQRKKIRSAVRRQDAGGYVLTSLISFAATVIVTRAFLELTGYPQIGNSVLHIAHALWGGLLLIVAAILPLAYVNRRAIQASALLGGVGIGLFIDEVGKFITQANDYFFAPALPLIYGFILLNILAYLYLRRPAKADPRDAMYHVLEGLQDLLDGDLDTAEGKRIEEQLAAARRSERAEVVALARALTAYLKGEGGNLPAAEPGFWKQVMLRVDGVGKRIGRRRHRVVITVVLIGWIILVTGYVFAIVWAPPSLDPQVVQWHVPLVVIQVIVGVLMVEAAFLWLRKKEGIGLRFGVSGFLVSLVALQLLYFYLSQFAAITTTLLQLVFLQVLFSYRRWYLDRSS